MSPRGGRLTPGSPTDALQHWRKAARFAQAAHDDLSARRWETSYSNAIFGVIHAADALCLRFLGLRSSSQAHFEAADLVERIPEMPAKARDAFVDHFRALLDAKGLVHYAHREIGEAGAKSGTQHMVRAFEAVRELVRGFGWPEALGQ